MTKANAYLPASGPSELPWRRWFAAVAEEWRWLPWAEKLWIEERLARIQRLQTLLQQLAERAQASTLCAVCGGYCCDQARHHFNLVNLLGHVQQGLSVPEPDFSRSCPFITSNGCPFSPGLRPLICVVFLCDAIERRFTQVQHRRFQRLEAALRHHYLAFCQRYQGASLQGLWLRAETLQGHGFLARRYQAYTSCGEL